MRRLKILLLGSTLIMFLLIGAGCETVQPGVSDIPGNRRPIQNRMEDERRRWVKIPEAVRVSIAEVVIIHSA